MKHEVHEDAQSEERGEKQAESADELKGFVREVDEVFHIKLPEFSEGPAAASVGTGEMGHGDFGPASDAGDDAGGVEEFKGSEFESAEDFGVVEFEGAAEVTERGLGDAAHDHVGDFRREHAEWGIAAVDAVAADEVVSFVVLLDETREVFGRELEVAVDEEDRLAAGPARAGGHGGELSAVFEEVDDGGDVGVFFEEFFHDFEGAVGAAVVNHDDFVGAAEIVEGGRQLGVEFGEAFLLEVGGHDRGDLGLGVFRHSSGFLPSRLFPARLFSEDTPR